MCCIRRLLVDIRRDLWPVVSGAQSVRPIVWSTVWFSVVCQINSGVDANLRFVKLKRRRRFEFVRPENYTVCFDYMSDVMYNFRFYQKICDLYDF